MEPVAWFTFVERSVSGAGTEAMVMVTDLPSSTPLSLQREMDFLEDWFI